MIEPVEVQGESRMMIGDSTSVVAWDTNVLRKDSVLPTRGKAFAQPMIRLDVLSTVMADRAAEMATGHDHDHANRPAVRS